MLLALALIACRGETDADGDGFPEQEDCNDLLASVNPDAPETCNGLDDDCDGVADESPSDGSPWYVDADGDGYGDPESSVLSCAAVAGAVANDRDCDDGDPSVHPGAVELCDGVDNDCSGDIDADAVGGLLQYVDADGDGFGAGAGELGCDGDGFVTNDDDCDDASEAVNPDAEEVCNGVDDDCDGDVDADAADASTWYLDADGDGFGGARFTAVECEAPSGYVADATDCDDLDDETWPGAPETCDGDDDDCDGDVDEDAVDPATFYRDVDGDGYGDPAVSESACEPSSGYVDDASDCDDGDLTSFPGGEEVCDDADNDCDGDVDEGASDASTWYIDLDGDGHGSSLVTVEACDQPSGYLASATDCDDLDSSQHPGATETCNEEDDDCDGDTDEGAGTETFYADVDGDGFGDPSSGVVACEQPSGYVDNDDDCDDGDGAINPDATETCDGVDEDCDGVADNGALGDDPTCAADSCYDIQQDRTDSPGDGVYYIDTSGGASYEVWCDMTLQGGGWTLLAVITNNDSTSWLPSQSAWTTTTTFGDPSDPTVNADAKSQAFNELAIDELMIVHGSSTVGVVSDSGCIGANPLLTIFQRNSESDGDCAWACGMATQNSPWTGQSYQGSQLGFRCADVDATYTDPGGYTYKADNSFITTLNNSSYRDNNFGLGSGENQNWVDWDKTTADGGDGGDTTQVLVYGR